MPWWFMPAITLGIILYFKYKKEVGKFRWVFKTEQELSEIPIGYIMAKVLEHGDVLPPPKAGFMWKPLKIMIATSPFAAPSKIIIHVLQPTAGGDLRGFLTMEQIKKAPDSRGMGAFGTIRNGKFEALQKSLFKQGLQLTEIRRSDVTRRDFVVLRNGSIHRIEGFGPGNNMSLRQLHPNKGVVEMYPWRHVLCVFGIRRSRV